MTLFLYFLGGLAVVAGAVYWAARSAEHDCRMDAEAHE